MRSHLRGIFDGDDGAAWHLQEAHLLSDFHVAHHGTTVESNLTASLHCGINSCLNAVNVRCEGSDDDALASSCNKTVEGCWDITLGCGNTWDVCICRVTEHEVDALITETRQRRKVGWTTIEWGLVQLDVTGVDDVASWSAQHDAKCIWNRVVNCPEACTEWTVAHIRLLIDLNELWTLTVFLTLRSNQRDGETGCNDRDIGAQLQQPWNRTDVVLVCVGDNQGFNLVDLVLDWAEVRQNQVDAWLAGGWEEHTTVNDQQLAVVFKDGHVAADFRNAAQRVDTQGAVSLLWWLWQTLGQIRTLHGLRNVAAVVVVSTTTVVAATLVATALVIVAALVVLAAILTIVILAIAATATTAGTTRAGTTVVVAALVIVRGVLLGVSSVTGIIRLLLSRGIV